MEIYHHTKTGYVIYRSTSVNKLQFNYQLPVELRIDFHILVAVWVHNHPCFTESVVE